MKWMRLCIVSYNVLASVLDDTFTYQLFNYQKADDKISVVKFSKNVKFKLCHIENSKTRGQTV